LAQSPAKSPSEEFDAEKLRITRHPVDLPLPLPGPATLSDEPDRRAARVGTPPPLAIARAELSRQDRAGPPAAPDRKVLDRRLPAEPLAGAAPSLADDRRLARTPSASAVAIAPLKGTVPFSSNENRDIPQVDDIVPKTLPLPKPAAVATQHVDRPPPVPAPVSVPSRVRPDPTPVVAAHVARPNPESPDRDMLAMLPKTVPMPTVKKPLPPTMPTTDSDSASPAQVRVNTEELTAQIAGSNMALRTIEAELDEKRTWDAARLETIVARLDSLVVKHKDLTLFRDLITADEQSLVGRISSPQPVLDQAAARIAEASRRAKGDDFTGTEDERRTEVRRLEELLTRVRK
jgi:hypothetical protein